MKQIQFRWIEAFRAVASVGSTIDAARLLGLDQSAVSRHIAALEGQLDVRLFDRRTRSLKLTSVGEQLLPEAEAAINALHRFQRKAQAMGSGVGGHLQIVTSATLARGLLPHAVGPFSKQAVDATVNIEVVSRLELEKKIESQEFDVCAIALPHSYPVEQMLHLGRFPGVCVLPRRHRLAKRDVIQLRELADETLIGLPLGTVGRMQITELFQRSGLSFSPTVETTAVALNELVASGSGIAITDPFTARVAAHGTVVRPLRPTIDYEFALLFPIGRTRPPLVQAFAEAMQRSVASEAEQLHNQES